MDIILHYINEKYSPAGLIVYGSYADGSNNEHSDFDALVITGGRDTLHDVSFVDGVQLDVFVYPAEHFESEYNCDDFIQIADGRIITDTDGTAARLMASVEAYLTALPLKTLEEVRSDIEWCKKMLLRTARSDPEGMFRRHWLIVDSLEIYCAAMGQQYRGPKKALRWMEMEQAEAFGLYCSALHDDDGAITAWVEYLVELMK